MVILRSLDEAAERLREGQIGVIPTDTVYGVVCSASSLAAVKQLYTLKHRHHKPGTLIAASTDQLVELGVPRRYLRPVEHFWPNPISVVIPLGFDLPALHLGKGSLACRIPKQDELQALLQVTGPLLTSSANHPGESPATTLLEATDYFGDEVDFYIDGGDFADHKPSTIIRVVDDAVEVLREGALKVNEYGEVEPC